MEEVKVLSFFRFRLGFKQVMEMFTPSYNTKGLHSGFLVFIFHIVVIITRELYKPQIFWKGEHSIALVLSHQYSDFPNFIIISCFVLSSPCVLNFVVPKIYEGLKKLSQSCMFWQLTFLSPFPLINWDVSSHLWAVEICN